MGWGEKEGEGERGRERERKEREREEREREGEEWCNITSLVPSPSPYAVHVYVR